MKALKLRRVDKIGVVIAITIPAVMWFWLHWPLQRCKVHGTWLRTGQTVLRPISSPYIYECDLESGCSEAGVASYNETVEYRRFPERNKSIRYCPRCRSGMELKINPNY